MNLDVLEEEFRRLIDIREGVGREIASCRARFGENPRRREDQMDRLQSEYNRIQRRYLKTSRFAMPEHPEYTQRFKELE